MTLPRSTFLGLIGLLGLAPSLTAEDTPSVEARLSRIEAALQRLESRIGDAVTVDELAPTLKEFSNLTRQLEWDGQASLTVAKAGGKENRLSIGGYIQAQGEVGHAPDSRYTGINNRVLLRRARLTVKGAFPEKFEFTLQSDFGNNSIGATTGYRAQLADMFLAWTKYESAVVQLGQFKTPFGFEQLLADTKVATAERSLPNDQLTVGRQLGLGVSGTFVGKKISYAVGAFNGNGVNNGNNDNQQFMYAGRVAVTPWSTASGRFSLGVDGYTSRDTGTFTGNRTGRGIDGQLTLGAFDFTAEYLRVLQDRVTGTDTTADGTSLQAAWFFVPKVWQAVVRYERYDSNVDAPLTTSTNWVLGLNYCIRGDDLKLTFNCTVGDPAGPLSNQARYIGRLQLIF